MNICAVVRAFLAKHVDAVFLRYFIWTDFALYWQTNAFPFVLVCATTHFCHSFDNNWYIALCYTYWTVVLGGLVYAHTTGWFFASYMNVSKAQANTYALHSYSTRSRARYALFYLWYTI